MPPTVDFTVLGLAVQTETGERVKLRTDDVAQELGALAYLKETVSKEMPKGDWAQALRYAQRQAKRAVIQRFVRWVYIGLDDQGEAQVELELAVPIEVELPANWPAQFRYSTD